MNISQCFLLAGLAGAVSAQPFVHNVAEPIDAREVANDVKSLSTAEIATVGAIDRESQNLRRDGWIVVHGRQGTPLRSWIIEDNDSLEDPLLATFEDPADTNLIVLQQGITQLLPMMTDLVLFKIDTNTGALAYQWRYEGFNELRNLGMERDDETGLVAALIRSPQGTTQCTLLRFRNATGLPIFHNRYIPIGEAAFDLRFFDVAHDPESGDIFAVGYVRIDDPAFSPATDLLLARFDAFGNPIWVQAYETRTSDQQAGPILGASIELTDTLDIAVSARQLDPSFGQVSVHLLVDRVGAFPIAVNALSVPNAGIEPAFSSLELLGDDTLLVSGNIVTSEGVTLPAMWNVKASNQAFNWIYVPDVLFGSGNSAIPQPGFGPLLAGDCFPPNGPIGMFNDGLLARTDFNGVGLCDIAPKIRELDVSVNQIGITLKPVQMEPPNQAGLEVIGGDPVFDTVCEPCRPDLNMDGSLDFFDINLLLSNMIDYNGDTVFDFFDISEFLMDFGAGCP